ncbi:MAG: RidA family protein [Mesorhizobium sp.]|nr:RidA family protein [Mesorhizobium sp.]
MAAVATVHEELHPANWAKPRGYANGIAATGKLVFIGGQIGWTGEQNFEAKDLAGQTRQALSNILAVLAEAGGRAEHITRFTWYIVDKQEYLANLKDIGTAYREVMGKHFPAMAMVQIVALIEDEAKVEIEATAVIPEIA